MPRTLFYNTFIVVSDVYGTLTRDQYNPKPSVDGIWELIDEYDILESIEYLEFKNIDTNYRTRIVIDGLRGGIVSGTQMFCRVACDDIYMETDYYCESSIINSGESYSYVRNKNRANSYQITNDRYSYGGIKTGASANIELDIHTNYGNIPEKFLSCTILNANDISNPRLFRTISSCLIYTVNQINGLKLSLNSGAINSGHVKVYRIR